MNNLDYLSIIYLIVKIAAVFYSLMHFLTVLFISRQILNGVKIIKTGSYRILLSFISLHAIILLLFLLIIVILPYK